MYGIINHVTKPGDRITVALFKGLFVKLDISNEERQARNLLLGALVWCPDNTLTGLVCVDTRDCKHGTGHGQV